jgi:hypothetical protein
VDPEQVRAGEHIAVDLRIVAVHPQGVSDRDGEPLPPLVQWRVRERVSMEPGDFGVVFDARVDPERRVGHVEEVCGSVVRVSYVVEIEPCVIEASSIPAVEELPAADTSPVVESPASPSPAPAATAPDAPVAELPARRCRACGQVLRVLTSGALAGRCASCFANGWR